MMDSVLSREIEVMLKSMATIVEQVVERVIERPAPASTPAPANEDLLVNVEDAAKRLGLARSTVYKMAARVELPSVKLGRRLLFRVADLATFAEKHLRSPEKVARLASGVLRTR